MIALLILLGLTTSAYAECAWVLWESNLRAEGRQPRPD